MTAFLYQSRKNYNYFIKIQLPLNDFPSTYFILKTTVTAQKIFMLQFYT